MTIDVKALRALLDKATPGEWRAASQWARCTLDHDGRGGGHGRGACAYLAQPPEPHDHEIIVPCPAGAVLGERIIVAGTWDYEEGGIQRAEDTALIVAAVNALPDLLALAESGRFAAERDALRSQLAAANARADAATAFSDAQVKRLQERGTDLAVAINERDALRDDLARVTAERDDLSHAMLALVTLAIDSFGYGTAPMPAAVRKSVPLSGKHLHDFLYEKSVETNALRDERRTAREAVRDLVDGLTALLLVLPDGPTRCPACNCSWSDREIAKMRDDRAGACWCGKWAFDIDTLLAKHAAPAPTPADAKPPPAAVPGLVFGPRYVSCGEPRRDGVAVDGCAYWIMETGPDDEDGPWFWGNVDGEAESCATEAEAIAAASAHNAARLAKKGGE